MTRRRKYHGWGFEGEAMTAEEEAATLANFSRLFGVDHFEQRAAPALQDITLPAPRITAPAGLAAICSTAPYDRALHSFGKSYPDTVHGLEGEYDSAPDVVAVPRNEREVAEIIDWAAGLP
ncbi:MAG: hypothetical protein ACREF0_21375, partial [Acetobacteraceae bacterium]